ncbi:hypothetical protein ACFPIF_10310 [Brevundimonas faecalis]|uniref:hypothetical protein n=1 Tax=Brevundimonas faecalis TaxID=947378 RepID=UPI00360F033C
MATVRAPRLFTQEFGVSIADLQAHHLFDPVLNVDTKLFIDPTMLHLSNHPKIATAASEKVKEHFRKIYRLLSVQPQSYVTEVGLQKLLSFGEVAGNCLGYTAGGIAGHGFGPEKRDRFLKIAKQVEEAGRSDPNLLPLLVVLEKGIGPDLISDMTTNIIIDELVEITQDFCTTFNVPMEEFEVKEKLVHLPRNNHGRGNKPTPIVLVPDDVLRELPVANSWEKVVALTRHNNRLRNRINEYILEIMKDERLSAAQRKAKAAEELQENAEAVARVGEVLAEIPQEPYETQSDPRSRRVLQRLVGQIEHDCPMAQPLTAPTTPTEMIRLVARVVEHFKFMVEEKGYWKWLWDGTRRLHEDVAQDTFFAIAYSFCTHYDVHIAVEHDTGDGRTDFIFSKGSHSLVVVELKWSNNPGLLRGYTKQVRTYIKSEKAKKAFYVVLDCDDGKAYDIFSKKIAKLRTRLAALFEDESGAQRTIPRETLRAAVSKGRLSLTRLTPVILEKLSLQLL